MHRGYLPFVMQYEVIEPVNHDQRNYSPGDTLELEDKHASPLLALGKIKKSSAQRESTLPPAQPAAPPVGSTSEADLLQTLPQRGVRETELKELFRTGGVKAIQAIAQAHGIVKPAAGWDMAIPLILDKEFPPDNTPDLAQSPS